MKTTSSTLNLNIREEKVIVLSELCIFIKISGDDDAKFFNRHKYYYPIFIRDNETPKFVLEKVQNTIIKSMKEKQERLLNAKK